MARLGTMGAEAGLTGSLECSTPTGTVTRDTGIFRKAPGVASYKCDSTGSNTTAYLSSISPNKSMISAGWLYSQAWIYFDNLPSTTSQIMRVYYFSGPVGFSIRLDSSGAVTLWNNAGSGSQIGSAWSGTIATGTWYRFGFSYQMTSTYNITEVHAYVNGTQFASQTGLYVNCASSPTWGWCTAPGASVVCHVDDIVTNSGTGGSLTTWPGDDEVVFALQPASDNTVGTGWAKPGGGTTNLYTSVDNVPPIGIADTTSATYAENQIRNPANNTNSYKANMQTYEAAGIVAEDTINYIRARFATAVAATTSPKSGSMSLTNPTVSLVDIGGFISGSTAAGTWPTGWNVHGTTPAGTEFELPSVTIGTAPVFEIQQTTGSTRVAMVCAMLILCSAQIYTEPPPAGDDGFPYVGGGYYG